MNHQISKPRLLAVLAHPDDESLGMGGTLAKYASEGVETYLLMATRGERGRYGLHKKSPGLDIVGRTRSEELMAASQKLGIGEVTFLDYIDGDLDQADPEEVIAKIASHIRRIQPQVVVTFGPEGSYGHPDHIAISQFTTAATIKAADPGFISNDHSAYSVSKLYYMAWPPSKWAIYQAAFKELSCNVDGVKRMAAPFPDWAITTRVDAVSYWKKVWEAILCHQTQMGIYANLEKLSEAQHQVLWGEQEFYRAFSTVNGGRTTETDLFEGVHSKWEHPRRFLQFKSTNGAKVGMNSIDIH